MAMRQRQREHIIKTFENPVLETIYSVFSYLCKMMDIKLTRQSLGYWQTKLAATMLAHSRSWCEGHEALVEHQRSQAQSVRHSCLGDEYLQRHRSGRAQGAQ